MSGPRTTAKPGLKQQIRTLSGQVVRLQELAKQQQTLLLAILTEADGDLDITGDAMKLVDLRDKVNVVPQKDGGLRVEIKYDGDDEDHA